MIAWVVDARAFKLVANLDDEQIMGPLLPKTNPLLWEIGHHAWFQFFWVLRPAASQAPVREDEDALYDSIAKAHDIRWDLPLPSRGETLDYVRTVLDRVAAIDWNFITHSPANGVTQLPEASQIPDALTYDQLDSLLKELPEYARLIVTILAYTGLRRSELHRITWGDIDFENNEIVIRTTKNSEFRVIPMHPQVRTTFSELRPGRSWPRTQSGQSRITIVWPDSNTPSVPVIPSIDIKKSLISASKRAGIGHVYPHMLRHTFATKMRDHGVHWTASRSSLAIRRWP